MDSDSKEGSARLDYSKGEGLIKKIAAMSELALGKGTREVEKATGIPESTLRLWKNSPEFGAALKENFSRIFIRLINARADAQIAILETMADKNYLKNQSADSLAMANDSFNNQNNRTFEMLERAQRNAIEAEIMARQRALEAENVRQD